MWQQQYPRFYQREPISQFKLARNFLAQEQFNTFYTKWPWKQDGWLYLLILLIIRTCSQISMISVHAVGKLTYSLRSSSRMYQHREESYIKSSSSPCSNFFARQMAIVEASTTMPLISPIVRLLWVRARVCYANELVVNLILLLRQSALVSVCQPSQMMIGPQRSVIGPFVSIIVWMVGVKLERELQLLFVLMGLKYAPVLFN